MKSAQEIASSLLQSLSQLEPQVEADFSAQETEVAYLMWMCHQVADSEDWSFDKAHRWVGYVQGVMCAKGWSSVETERDRVRGIASVKP